MALALLWPGGRLTQLEAGGGLASSRLIPALMQLLQRANLTMQGLDAIAFGAGPGAFTGLRTACSVAQGLAFAINRPVLPLDSLMLVAEDAAAQAGIDEQIDESGGEPCDEPIWVAMDARMDEVYVAQYTPHRNGWRVRTAPALFTLPALTALWRERPPAWVAGSAIEAFATRLPLGNARCVPREYDRAAALARLASRAWLQGLALPADQALPVYLRNKVALTTEERTQLARTPGGRGLGPVR